MPDTRPRTLNDVMDDLIVEARASGWSREGQIIYIRRGMERAYERVRKAQAQLARQSIQGKNLQLPQ